MFLKLIILSLILLSIAAFAFGIRIMFKSKGKFPETHVSRNEEMKKRGITCAQNTDTGCHSANGVGCACMR
jgi:hypothetical protein